MAETLTIKKREEMSFKGIRGGIWKKFIEFFEENGFEEMGTPEAYEGKLDGAGRRRIEEQIILINKKQGLLIRACSACSRKRIGYVVLTGEVKDDVREGYRKELYYKLTCEDYKEVYKSLDKTALCQSWWRPHRIYSLLSDRDENYHI